MSPYTADDAARYDVPTLHPVTVEHVPEGLAVVIADDVLLVRRHAGGGQWPLRITITDPDHIHALADSCADAHDSWLSVATDPSLVDTRELDERRGK